MKNIIAGLEGNSSKPYGRQLPVAARMHQTLIVSLSVLIVVLLAFNVLMRWPLPAAAILVWGIASFALVPPLQMRVMEAAKDSPNLQQPAYRRRIGQCGSIAVAMAGSWDEVVYEPVSIATEPSASSWNICCSNTAKRAPNVLCGRLSGRSR